MNLHLDAAGNVLKIEELPFEGNHYDINFLDGSVQHIKGIGRITQQCSNFPVIGCTLADALQFTAVLAHALGEGPNEPGVTNPVKSIACKQKTNWNFCFYDSTINYFDVIEYRLMGVQWIDEGGPQLSELGDPDKGLDFGGKILSSQKTITIVTPSAHLGNISPIGFQKK